MLMRGTPMLFQGQEFWASTPFLYFADHRPELAKLVREGRHKYMANFPSLATASGQKQLVDPEAVETFERCTATCSPCAAATEPSRRTTARPATAP